MDEGDPVTRVSDTTAGQPSAQLRRVERPSVHELLDIASHRRVCTVVAAAGWGKSSAVGAWARSHRTAWVRTGGQQVDPERFATRLRAALQTSLPPHRELPVPSSPAGCGASYSAALCAQLREVLREELVLVVDDLHQLPPESDPIGLLEGLCEDAPDHLHIVLVSRRECPFSLTRLRGQGLVAEIQASELAFDVAEVATLMRSALGEQPPGVLPAQVRERTAGWPAVVHGALDTLQAAPPERRLDVVDRLIRPGESLYTYLAEEVLDQEPASVRELLGRLAVLGESSAASLGVPGNDGARLLVQLACRGLVQRDPGYVDRWSLIWPLRDFYEHEPTPATDERLSLHKVAAQESVGRGAHADALRHLLAAADYPACAALLLEHGAALVDSCQLDGVLEVAEVAGEYLTDPRIQRVIGHARQVRGQWDAALECFQRAGSDQEPLEPGLAWQVGLIAYARGEFTAVIALRDRARLGHGDPADEARLFTLAGIACRMVGDYSRCRVEAERTLAAARRVGDPSLHAAGFLVRMVLATATGDRLRADLHRTNALEAATASGDLLQQLRVRVIWALGLVGLGMASEGLAEAQAALQLGESCGDPFLTAMALVARGRAHINVGEVEQAFGDFGAARDYLQRIGSRFLAWALCGLGDLYRMQGQPARGRAAYEEALALAEPCHDVLGLSTALIGLARIRATDDVPAARELAERAVTLDEGLNRVQALLARGWVALTSGDREAAAADATRAADVARSRRDGPGLADALVLSVLSAPDPARHGDQLAEAIEIWDEAGYRIEAATGRVVAGRVGASVPDLWAEHAERTLLECGVDVTSRRMAGPLAVTAAAAPALSIRTLGAFQVLRDGEPVPASEWQSRKARDLLKVLVAWRRVVTREQLMELLWPETDPVKSGKRLSVQLSGLRDVLRSPQNGEAGLLVTEGNVVRLDLTQVTVDVEQFLAHATSALDAHRGADPDAVELLRAAEAEYTGGFLEENPQEWAAAVAEEVRAVHIALLRALMERLRETGDVDGAVRCALKLLEQDGYDEQAHLALIRTHVGAGHHGEAKRRYQIYVARMNELGVPPRAFRDHRPG